MEDKIEKRKFVYKGAVEVGNAYFSDWQVKSRVLELNKNSDWVVLEVEGGPEDKDTLITFEVVALGPTEDKKILTRRLWRDCFFDSDKADQEALKQEMQNVAQANAGRGMSKNAKKRRRNAANNNNNNNNNNNQNKPPPSSSSKNPVSPASKKKLVLRKDDLPYEGVNKIQLRIFKSKVPYFGLFSRRSPALELRFRVETTVMQHTHDIASDVNFEFSETIYTTFENYMKFPLRELYLPDPPSKGRVFRKPCVLLLGGHSSGKSSFMNMLMKDKILETGSSPTTEEFVVLDYSPDARMERNVDIEEFPYDEIFKVHGVNPHISKRMLPVPMLKKFHLVDSPGVVDNQSRPYDFPFAAERMAKESDLVLFFFNFEHAESNDVISFFKRINKVANDHQRFNFKVLNRIDTADSVKDFAKTFATLMVNINRDNSLPPDPYSVVSPSSSSPSSGPSAPEVATGWLFPVWPQYYEIEKKPMPVSLGDLDDFVHDGKKILTTMGDAPVHCVRAKIHDLKLFSSHVLWACKARDMLNRRRSWEMWKKIMVVAAVILLIGLVFFITEGDVQFTAGAATLGAILAGAWLFTHREDEGDALEESIRQVVHDTRPSPLLPSSMGEEIEQTLYMDLENKKFYAHYKGLMALAHDVIRNQHPELETKLSDLSLVSRQFGYMDLDFEDF